MGERPFDHLDAATGTHDLGRAGHGRERHGLEYLEGHARYPRLRQLPGLVDSPSQQRAWRTRVLTVAVPRPAGELRGGKAAARSPVEGHYAALAMRRASQDISQNIPLMGLR